MGQDSGMRPFRFLAPIGDGIPDARSLAAEARRAESIGIDVLVRSDHLLEQYAPLPVLATVAAVTERIRIGTFVLNAGLRHPAVLAQELASLDVLSGGRLEIGVGAGWNARSTTRSGCRSARCRSGSSGWPRPSTCWRAASAPARSPTPGPTSGSMATTASPSRCSSRGRRCSSAAAAGGR